MSWYMGVIPVPPAISPIASCLAQLSFRTLSCDYLFSSHLYLGIGPRILRSCPGAMPCMCVLIGPFGYFLINNSNVPCAINSSAAK